ncbi:MAG TPA: DUF3798 domain-containing protein [Clostridia bacterium]|nr:DUF3798 domain-containing protein [Clostridia bacterium]
MKRVKKTVSLLLAVMMLVLVGCGGSSSKPAASQPSESTGSQSTPEASTDYKIAILYTDASQGEEPVRAYEKLKAQYGDKIVGAVIPNNESEALMSTALSLVSDPKVKALLVFQEPVGTVAAVDACREIRPDILYAAGVIAEDPVIASEAFDVMLNPNQIKLGELIIKLAQNMGTKTFVHYSFPRHMAMALLSSRRDVMEDTCKELGIEFINATAPDPMGDAGVSGTQQFILEDIPKKVAEYGKDTAFFGTNTAMMDVIVKGVVENGGILPSTCDPSPFQGFISGLGISIPGDRSSDPQYAVEQIKAALAAKNMSGRLATWPVASSSLYFYSIYEYACQWAEGKITQKTDINAMQGIMTEVGSKMAGTNVTIYLEPYELQGKTYDTYFAFMMDYLVL